MSLQTRICADCNGAAVLLEWGRREVTCNRCSGSGLELVAELATPAARVTPAARPETLFDAPQTIRGQLALPARERERVPVAGRELVWANPWPF